MKKVLILLIFSFLTCFVTFAQNSSNSTVILTAEQYNALPINVKESIEKENTYKTIGKWAGLGKEIGEGVNSALMAIEGSATRISETTLGKTAMNVVVWKFVGKDIIRIIIGILVYDYDLVEITKEEFLQKAIENFDRPLNSRLDKLINRDKVLKKNETSIN